MTMWSYASGAHFFHHYDLNRGRKEAATQMRMKVPRVSDEITARLLDINWLVFLIRAILANLTPKTYHFANDLEARSGVLQDDVFSCQLELNHSWPDRPGL